MRTKLIPHRVALLIRAANSNTNLSIVQRSIFFKMVISMIKKGGQQNTFKLNYLATLLFHAVVVLFAASCSQQKNKNPIVETGQKELIAPTTTLLSALPEKNKPKKFLLDAVSKPSVKKIPVKNRIVLQANEAKIGPYFAAGDTSKSTLINEAKGRGFFTT